jgi:hypothetical protein
MPAGIAFLCLSIFSCVMAGYYLMFTDNTVHIIWMVSAIVWAFTAESKASESKEIVHHVEKYGADKS